MANQPPLESLVGQRFGRLTVKRQSGIDGRKRIWLCVCDCGGDTSAATADLRAGKIKSCGCLARERNHRTFGLFRRKIRVSGTYCADDARESLLMDD